MLYPPLQIVRHVAGRGVAERRGGWGWRQRPDRNAVVTGFADSSGLRRGAPGSSVNRPPWGRSVLRPQEIAGFVEPARDGRRIRGAQVVNDPGGALRESDAPSRDLTATRRQLG